MTLLELCKCHSILQFPLILIPLARKVFGSSPDETAYNRHLLDKEPIASCLVMIQPQLIAFSIHQPPRPVLLDVQSIISDEILVLDTFSIVLVHHGSTVVQWMQAGYAEMPEHSSFRQAVCSPLSKNRQVVQACALLQCTSWLCCTDRLVRQH